MENQNISLKQEEKSTLVQTEQTTKTKKPLVIIAIIVLIALCAFTAIIGLAFLLPKLLTDEVKTEKQEAEQTDNTSAATQDADSNATNTNETSKNTSEVQSMLDTGEDLILESGTIGLTYDEITYNLADRFTMEEISTEPIPTYEGLSENYYARLMVYGPKDDIYSAGLVYIIEPADFEITAENTAMALRFVMNAAPNSEDAQYWAASAIIEVRSGDATSATEVFDNRLIAIKYIDDEVYPMIGVYVFSPKIVGE